MSRKHSMVYGLTVRSMPQSTSIHCNKSSLQALVTTATCGSNIVHRHHAYFYRRNCTANELILLLYVITGTGIDH